MQEVAGGALPEGEDVLLFCFAKDYEQDGHAAMLVISLLRIAA